VEATNLGIYLQDRLRRQVMLCRHRLLTQQSHRAHRTGTKSSRKIILIVPCGV